MSVYYRPVRVPDLCFQVFSVKGKYTVELGCYPSISQLLALIAKQFFQKLN